MQAQLDALQTDQLPLSFHGDLDTSANAGIEQGQSASEAKHREQPQLEKPEQQLQQSHAELASQQAMCEALRGELQGERQRIESLEVECKHSQSQNKTLGAAVAGHLGLESITAGDIASALAAHQAAHEATVSGLHKAVAAAQREVASAQTGHADSLAAADGRLSDLQKERDVLLEQLRDIEARSTTLSTEVTSYKERHAGLADQHTQLQTTSQELQAQHSMLQSQHADLSAQLGSLQEEHVSLMQQHQALRQEHLDLQQSSQTVEAPSALESLQKEHAALKEDLAAREKALAEHKEAAAGNEQLNQQLQQLQAALNTAETERASAMQQLEALMVRASLFMPYNWDPPVHHSVLFSMPGLRKQAGRLRQTFPWSLMPEMSDRRELGCHVRTYVAAGSAGGRPD